MKLNNKYFLLRHGQTIYQKNSVRINYPADADSTLSITEEGKEMIKNAAENLKKEKISIIFASPALRTKQSSEIAAKILGIKKINYDKRLLDIKMGEFVGKTYEEYENFF
ncbi:MAG: histidine phosphatase family protein, partial [Patescibacteria group bacterium]